MDWRDSSNSHTSSRPPAGSAFSFSPLTTERKQPMKITQTFILGIPVGQPSGMPGDQVSQSQAAVARPFKTGKDGACTGVMDSSASGSRRHWPSGMSGSTSNFQPVAPRAVLRRAARAGWRVFCTQSRPAYFSRCFRKVMGRSPRTYRKEFGANLGHCCCSPNWKSPATPRGAAFFIWKSLLADALLRDQA